jgi:GT2 family glycosyltransferase
LSLPDVGVVAIGRNEGARLVRCLDSLPAGLGGAVYVDSGSTDQSVAEARRRGVDVVDLDMTKPFTAARARNAGFERLLANHPELTMVHFFDGDCEIVAGWVEAAVATMRAAPDVAAVCGWRRERHADQTVYNTLCDIEWRMGRTGEIKNFGGDVLIRAEALRSVGGYDPRVIAAEDDELGVRLRAAGWRLTRIDRVSTLHDAAITRAKQWWQRAKRGGHGYAQVNDMHGAPPERYFEPEVRRTWTWGLAVPALAAGLALPTLGLSLGLFGAYPVQMLNTYRNIRRRGFTTRESALWAISCTASKVPESVGILKYHLSKRTGNAPKIIEYKGAQD